MKIFILFLFIFLSLFSCESEDKNNKKCPEGKIYHPYFQECVIKTCEEGEMINHSLNSYCNYGCEESTQNAFIICSK